MSLERHASAYDPIGQRMIVFGGAVNSVFTDSLWECSLSGAPRWRPVSAAGIGPTARGGHSLTYDPIRDRMLVFGGFSIAGHFNEVWELALRPQLAWTLLTPDSTAPAPREYHSTLYDPWRDQLVICGGVAGPLQSFTSVWRLKLSPRLLWDSAGALPSVRARHAAVLDPVEQRVIVFGGEENESSTCHALDLRGGVSWSSLATTGVAPSHRFGHAAFFDPLAQAIVVFGGSDLNREFNETWRLRLRPTPAWERLAPRFEVPSARSWFSLAVDSLHERAVVVGGYPPDPDRIWALSMGSEPQWFPNRPLLRPTADSLRPPAVTLGDTMLVELRISSGGLDSLRVGEIELPATFRRTTDPGAFTLAWKATHAETLQFIPTSPGSRMETITVHSSDPRSPTVSVFVETRALPLEFDVKVLGSPAEVPLGAAFPVVVTPAAGVRMEGGALHFRASVAGATWASTELTSLASDFLALVPAEAVTEHDVDYFVVMRNSAHSDTLPAGAPTEHFTQNVAEPQGVTANPRADILQDRDVEVEIDLPAGAVFSNGTLSYRRGGEVEYSTVPVEPLGSGVPTARIPASAVGSRGIHYWVEVHTAARSLRFPPGEAEWAELQVRSQDLTEGADHPGGRYRMLSVPLEFDAASHVGLGDLLTNQFGPYDRKRWRAFRFTSAGTHEELAGGTPEAFELRPGRAFWLVSKSNHRVTAGKLPGKSTSSAREFPIALHAGWNLVGNPFDFDVAWADVRRDENNVTNIKHRNPNEGMSGEYEPPPQGLLRPFEGYFVFADHPDTIWIPAREAATPGGSFAGATAESAGLGSSRAPVAPGSWIMSMDAATASARDGGNLLGVVPGASAKRDACDEIEPPAPPGEWVQLWIAGAETGRVPLSTDLRSPSNDGESWEIHVRSHRAGEAVTVTLDEFARNMARPQIQLFDREQQSLVGELLEAPSGDAGPGAIGAAKPLSYTFVSRGPVGYRLTVLAGSLAYLEREGSRLATRPLALSFDRPAPNPFQGAVAFRFGLPHRTTVDLEVFDAAGRRVSAPLLRQQMEGGYHSSVWDGRGHSGVLAPNGVYMVRLRVDGVSLSRRVALLR
jgi:hypothetical protein